MNSKDGKGPKFSISLNNVLAQKYPQFIRSVRIEEHGIVWPTDAQWMVDPI